MNRSSQLGKQNAATYLKSVSLCFFLTVDCMPGLLSVLHTLHFCRRSPYGGGLTDASASKLEGRR